MSRELQSAPLLRCLVVWSTATAAAIALAALAADELATASVTTFNSLVVTGCSLTLLVCAAWFWLAASVVVVGALRGASWSLPGCPSGLARLLMTACGVALLVPAAPAWADSDSGPTPVGVDVLAGLPLPERATHGPDRAVVVVAPGESLWSIAEQALGREATASEVDREWRAIWAANRSVIGADPDLIHPGARLRLPRRES